MTTVENSSQFQLSSQSSFIPEKDICRIVIIKKDGEKGSSFGITQDITFGREKDCDIRIKLSSVSRLHAKIETDQNGAVSEHKLKYHCL